MGVERMVAESRCGPPSMLTRLRRMPYSHAAAEPSGSGAEAGECGERLAHYSK